MSKLKLFWVSVLCVLAGALAWVLDLFRRQEQQRARDKVAADLRAKVAEVRAQRATEKAEMETKVAAIQAEADAAKAADPVDVANALILGAKSDKS